MPTSPPSPTPTRPADASPAAKPARNAGDTRGRILAAARRRFSQDAYENVGTRDIAADAGVDAALVSRYFGGKEKLFEAVIAGVFRFERHLPLGLEMLGEHLVRAVMDPAKGRADTAATSPDDDFDALGLLLRSTGSPATGPLVAACFHEEFVRPLARLLRGPDAELRAALIASHVLGLATMKHALHSPALGPSALRKTAALVGVAIQACVDG